MITLLMYTTTVNTRCSSFIIWIQFPEDAESPCWPLAVFIVCMLRYRQAVVYLNICVGTKNVCQYCGGARVLANHSHRRLPDRAPIMFLRPVHFSFNSAATPRHTTRTRYLSMLTLPNLSSTTLCGKPRLQTPSLQLLPFGLQYFIGLRLP